MPCTDLDILYQFLRHFMTVLPYIYFIGVEPVHCSGRLHSEEDTRTEEPGSRQTKPTGPTGCPESWHNKPKTPIEVANFSFTQHDNAIPNNIMNSVKLLKTRVKALEQSSSGLESVPL